MWTKLRRLFFSIFGKYFLAKGIRKKNWALVIEVLEAGVNPNMVFRHTKFDLYKIFGFCGAERGLWIMLPYGLDIDLCDLKKNILLEVAINLRNENMFDVLLLQRRKNGQEKVASTGKGIVHFAAEHVYALGTDNYLGLQFVERLLGEGIVWRAEDFPLLDPKIAEEYLSDEIHGLHKMAKYLVKLVNQ